MTNRQHVISLPSEHRAWVRGGVWLGVALGGFFDGIVLHQVLQWHHLFSAIEAGPLRELRWQIMADGVFHALMYLIALWGGWRLYRGRRHGVMAGAGRELVAALALGFGLWHVIDAVLSHWLIGLHRVRMDVSHPLAWDLAWVLVFGLVPLLASWWLRRDDTGAGPDGRAAGMLVVTLIAGSAWISVFPARAPVLDTVTVVLRPGADFGALSPVLSASDARILWSDAAGSVWVLRPMGEVDRAALLRAGAMYVSGGLGLAGCAQWSRGSRGDRPRSGSVPS